MVYGAGLPGLNHGVLRDHLPVEVLEALSCARETGRMQQQHATAAFCALFAASGVDERQAECAVADEDDAIRAASHWALALPLEVILAQGGDARLRVDPKRGLNRYGTAPRPRPEAIQFSSSTASSISDYGFLLCDEIRRRLLRESLAAPNNRSEPWEELADAIRAEISALLALGPEQADIVLAPSGTDTEFLAVLLALGGSAGHPLTNVLIAPEETGRGVALAGEGRYFDESTAVGIPVTKGAPRLAGLGDRELRRGDPGIYRQGAIDRHHRGRGTRHGEPGAGGRASRTCSRAARVEDRDQRTTPRDR